VKRVVKFVLCLLIVWLPLSGFAEQVLTCPQVSSTMGTSHTARHHSIVRHTAVSADAATHLHSATSTTHQPGCHGSIGGLACSIAALPATPVAVVAAPSTSIYASFDATLPPQFIPDLPQRPPQVL
jgi:hypothetical protein